METNKESDSKEDSVIEAKPAIRFLASTDFKKEKFHGFYKHIQKTIVADSSVDDVEENQNFNEKVNRMNHCQWSLFLQFTNSNFRKIQGKDHYGFQPLQCEVHKIPKPSLEY